MELNFLGIGSAWNTNEDNTSAYIKKDDKMILIDCGESIARKIIANDILSDIKELYILISHTHSDHVGSLGTLLFYSKYNKQIVNKIVLPKDECFTENLKEYLRLVDITTEVEFVDFMDLISAFNLIKFDILKATFLYKNHSITNEEEFIEFLIKGGMTHRELQNYGFPLRKIQIISKKVRGE